MRLDVEAAGQAELSARLNHASQGVMHLDSELTSQLVHAMPPQVAFQSVTMHARAWGTGDVWTLPAGTWVAARDGRVHLPDDPDQLTDHLQGLLDGS